MKWAENRTNFERNLAVIIGIDHYDHKTIHDLSTAVNDANRFANLLRQNYDYQEEHIVRLFSPRPDADIDHLSQPYRPATLDELNILLDDTLPNKLKPTDADRLLLYFAGHGIAENGDQGPAGYLIPQTAEIGDPKTYLAMQRLSTALNQLSCHHLLVILDCCFGGAFRWASTRKLIADLEVIHKENYDRFIRFPAWQVITSAAHDQEALDLSVDRRVTGEAAVHSPFAQALFEGLQGNKADLIADEIITAHELYCYLDNRVSVLSNNQQTPGIYPIRRDYDKGEYIFTQPGFSRDQLSEAPPLNRDNNPYRGLKPFEEKHARFFFGRTALRKELIDRLNQPTDIQTERLKSELGKVVPPLTVVLGGSGSGKSSLVQAGLLPDLRQKQADQWYLLDPFRPGEAPFTALARAILPIVKPELLQQLSQPDFLDTKLQSLLAEAAASAEPASASTAPTAAPDPKIKLTKLARSWNSVTPEARLLIVEDYFTQLQTLFSSEQVQQFQAFNQAIQGALRQIATDLKQPQYLTQVITDWSQQPGQPDRKLLMVIDQFEELVTLTPGQNQAQTAEKSVAPDQGCTAFLEVIRQALSAHPQQLRVLLTLRSDFEPRFLTSPLQDWWQYARFPVRPMNSDELREAIEGPAQIQALYFEPSDLVGTLTDEVGQMPGALPLLSFTLSELYNELAEKWRKQEVSDRALCLEDYNKLGGVVGSLSKRATEEYENLVSDSEGFGAIVGKTYQATMQRLMLRMVTIEGGNVARRRVLLTELEYPTTAENRRVEVVVERLVTARLLVRGQEAEVAYVEPAHDFLVRGWDKLQKWLKDEQETLTLQQRLTPAATDWNTRRQDELPVNWREKTLALGDRSVFYIVEFVQSRRRKALQKRRAKAAKIIRKDSIGYLWDEDPRLEQLNRLVGAQDSWFNRTEDLFVRQSVVQKEKNWIGKLLLAVGITVLTGVLLRWVLLSQKDKLLEQVRASRESAEANLQSDHELEAMIDTLRAGKTLNDPLNLLNPYLWTAPAEVEAEVKETLFKVLSTARERNRLQLNRAAIYNVAVNPQGDELATTEDDDTVRLWDRSGRQLDQFPTGQGGVKSVAFNLDGNQLATGGENGTVLLWTIKDRKIDLTQKPIEIFKAHKGELPEGAILSLAFSQNRTDNQRLAIVDSNLKIWLWNLTKSRMSSANAELQKNSANTHIYSVTFNPDREQLATVGDDDTVELWDVVTGKQLDRFSTGQKIVYSVAFRDGNHLATGGAGKKVKLWTIGDDRKLDQSVEPENITTEQSSTYSLSFSRSGLLATVGNDEAVTIHTGVSNLTSDPKIQPARGNRQDVEVQGLAFSPNGKLIATVSADNQLRLWDLAGSQVARYQVGGKNVDGVAFSPNGELIATGAEDGTIELRDTQGNFLDRVSLDELQQSKLASIVFEPRGQRLAAIAESGVVEWLAIENQTFKKTGEIPVIERFQAPIKGIQRLAFAPNLRQVAVLQTSGVVSLWDYPSKKFRFILQTNKRRVSGITFSPNGQSLATAHPDGTVKLWQIERNADETITAIRPSSLEFQTHQGAIKNIAFSRINSNLLVTGGQDGTARIWDIATGQPPQFFLPSLTHPASAAPAANLPEIIKQAAFSPDAQRLATLGADQKLKLWHVDEQNLIQLEQELPLTPKQQLLAPVKSLVFSLDSALLAVIRQDETLQIWDTALEQWLDPIQSAPGHRITSLRFSPDHQHFVVLEQDQNDQGTLRLYRRNPSAEKGFDLQDLSNTELKQMNMSSVAFNPTGSQLATARLTEEGTGGIVTVWNQNIDTKTAEFKTQHPISDLIFNQNGQLATFETDGTVKLWDLDDGKQEVGEFKASDPSDILEPDFTLPLNLSDLLPSVQPAARPPTSPRPIQSVPPPAAPQPPQPLPTQRRFSADGRLLAIVNHGKLSLWNALGNPLNLPSSAQQTQAEPVLSAAFDTEGKRLITLDQEGKLSFWQVGSVADLLTESCHLLQDYLKNTPTLNPSDRDLCSDILPPPDSENTSAGEQLLVAKITNSEKQAGVEAMAASDFAAASQHFQTALTVKRNDPETRIYWSNAQIRNQPSYTIAVAVPISSDADGAQEILRGVAQAQYEVNQAGGIRGNLLRILIADDQGSDEMARQTAQELVANPDVLGVVGHFSSNSTLAAGAIYNQNQLVAISPVSTSIALSNFGSFLFRTVPNDQQAAQKLATYMLHQLNLHQPALFYNSQSNYSLSLRSKFQSALPSSEQIKGDFDVSSPYFNAAESVTQAIDDGADVLVLLTNTAQLNNALAVVTANQHHLPLLAGDDIYSLKTLQQGKEDALGLVISVPWSINSAPPDFVATSNRLWQATVNWRTALSYDATKAIVEAIQRSGENPTRPKIATILHSDNFFILGASGKVAFQSSGDRAPESSLDRSLVQVVKSGRSRSGTGYDFETIDLPK